MRNAGAILALMGVLALPTTATASGETNMKLIVNSTFSDNMILQREYPVTVWGEGDPGRVVRVQLDGKEKSVNVDPDGRWRLVLDPLEAGGPFVLTVSSGEEAVAFKNVWVGDVWLCSGQSNMQHPVRETPEAAAELKSVQDSDRIHLYLVPKEGRAEPRDSVDASWNVASGEDLASFSAVGWFFAKELRRSKELEGVPIGLIDCSYGGTRVEAWMSPDLLAKEFDEADLKDSFLGWKPSSMRNGMLAPILPYAIRGVLWYQGESNCEDPDDYAKLFPAFIEELRGEWNRNDLPFYFVQIPNYAGHFGEASFTQIREVQREAANRIPHTGMAVTIDVGESYDVHPPNKKPIGVRLGKIARALTYGEDVVYSGPAFESAELEGARAVLHFDHVGGGMTNRQGGDLLKGFRLAGEEGIFWNAEARVEGETVVVRSDNVPSPRYVRYAWGTDPEVDLYNREGLPASPFRTDEFSPADLQISRDPSVFRFDSSSYEVAVEEKGALSQISVLGKEFLENGLPDSNGGYFVDVFEIPLVLTEFEVSGERILSASNVKANVKASMEARFREEGLSLELSNFMDEPRRFAFIVHPNVEVLRADSGLLVEEFPNEPTTAVTLYRENAALRIEGVDRITGPKSLFYRVVEAELGPRETRTLELAAAAASTEEAIEIARFRTAETDAPIAVLSPLNHQVFQRASLERGAVRTAGQVSVPADRVEGRLLGASPFGSLNGDWFDIGSVPETGAFSEEVELPAGGWYRLEIRAYRDGNKVGETVVENVGVGEVFVGAGQSNSTNYGDVRTKPESGKVAAFDGTEWRLAEDPQPGAADASTGGSFWPAFGDTLAQEFEVPVGVAVTGFGGTTVTQWAPGSDLFGHMMKRVARLGPGGFRALLWHQGENDYETEADGYFEKLKAVVLASRREAGWAFPWFVAGASYVNPDRPQSSSVREAQSRIWIDGVALPGPDTDTLLGEYRDLDGQGAHFNEKGLRRHGAMWAERVAEYIHNITRTDRAELKEKN